VVEDGTHAALVAREGGIYRRLRELQDNNGGTHAAPAAAVAAVAAHSPTAASAAAVHVDFVAATAAASAPAAAAAEPSAPATALTAAAAAPLTAAKAKAKLSPTASSGSAEAGALAKQLDLDAFKETLPPVDRLKVWRLQWPEAGYIVLGVLAACGGGVIQPVFAILWCVRWSALARCPC